MCHHVKKWFVITWVIYVYTLKVSQKKTLVRPTLCLMTSTLSFRLGTILFRGRPFSSWLTYLLYLVTCELNWSKSSCSSVLFGGENMRGHSWAIKRGSAAHMCLYIELYALFMLTNSVALGAPHLSPPLLERVPFLQRVPHQLLQL